MTDTPKSKGRLFLDWFIDHFLPALIGGILGVWIFIDPEPFITWVILKPIQFLVSLF